MFSGRRIVLGVTGGIAAYKSVTLLREFQKAGAEVRVMMTPAATRFVGVETFRALSRHPVPVFMFHDDAGGGVSKDGFGGGSREVQIEGEAAWDDGNQIAEDIAGSHWTKHIEWGEWADLVVIAPCTANTLADMVQGRSNTMLLATLLAARSPVMICPTMDGEMIRHPAVQENMTRARELGYVVVEPEVGYLASGLHDQGRLPEPERILEVAAETLKKARLGGPLAGRRVLVTAGPTREFLDPVRFLSNPSSGKMGVAMADAAAAMGGDVVLMRGPGVGDPTERMAEVLEFSDARGLMELVERFADVDVVVMAAAVSDYRPAETSTQKIKKKSPDGTGESEEVLNLKLVRNPDILRWLGERKTRSGSQTREYSQTRENREIDVNRESCESRESEEFHENQQSLVNQEHQENKQVLIGFAMESENLIGYAENKLRSKHLDWICANLIEKGKSGFETSQNPDHTHWKREKKGVSGRETGDRKADFTRDLFLYRASVAFC